MEKDVHVAFGDEVKIVKGVKWSSTARDIIACVLRAGDRTVAIAQEIKRYTLVEVWRGCVRALKHDDRVLKLLDKWRFALEGEPVPVRLKLVKRSQNVQTSADRSGQMNVNSWRGGRVATRKRRVGKQIKSKRRLITEIEHLTEKSCSVQRDIVKLTTLTEPQQIELKLPIDVSNLPPELEDECVALQEEYEEERKENADLLRRKDELTSNILSQKTDVDILVTTISSLEAKILNEHHKLNHVIETSGPPELKEVQNEVKKLQSELKVRAKLNQLQSAKNLEQRKSYPCPNLFNGEPQRVSDLYWISTHVFAVVYCPRSQTDNTPNLVFMFTSKDQPPSYVNCEDVYYGGGNKKNKFYFTYLSAWGIFVSCSSNALETVVHSHDPDNNTRWVQWELEDTGRAELPLDGASETYATGIALDLTSQKEVQVSESLVLPPCPLLLLYSDHGVLCPFAMINKDAAAATKIKELVKPAKPLPSDPRLVRQPKSPGIRGSPPIARPSQTAVSSTGAGSFIAPPPRSQPGQQQQQHAPPSHFSLGGSGLNLTSQKSPFSQTAAGVAGKASPLLGGLGQAPSFGQPPSFGQLSSSLGGQSLNASQPSGLSQPSPLVSQLSLKPGQVLGGSLPRSSQQQQQQQVKQLPSSGPLFGGSGVTGSVRPPSSFPFNAASLVGGSSSPLGTNQQQPAPTASVQFTSSPLQQQQQQFLLQQQRNQSPFSLPQSSLPSATTALTSGTSIGGLRFAPGYLSQAQQAAPPSDTTGPLPGQQLLAGSSAAALGLAKTVALPSSPVAPSASQLASVSVPGSLQTFGLQSSTLSQALPPPKQQQTMKPLHSSTPLAHPSGPHPQPRPLPPHLQPTLTRGVPPGVAADSAVPQPSPVLGGPAPPSVRMAAPKPVGGIVQGPLPTAATLVNQPRPMAHPMAYQTPGGVMGTRPLPSEVRTQPPTTYGGYGPPRPAPLMGGASAPPRLTHHPPPSAHTTACDSESLGSQNHLESKFATHIQNEIEQYTSDLESLKDDMRDLFGEWESVEGEKLGLKPLGDMDDLTEIKEEVELVENELTNLVKTFKLCEAQSSQLFEDTFKVYEMHAEAKANLRKKSDPSYATLYKVRPLDAYSSQILNNVRADFVRTERGIGEVKSQLDAQLEKKYEEKRQAGRRLLKVPSIQMIYSTLRDHRRISRLQSANLEKLTRDMKRLKMIPRSWRPSDAAVLKTPPTLHSPKTPTDTANGYVENGVEQGVWSPYRRQKPRQPSGDVMQTPVIDKMIASERLSRLRESLSNITQTPVRTLHSAPTYTLSDLQSDASSGVPSVPASGRQSPESFGGAILNQTRVLSHPPQPFLTQTLIPQDSESVHSLTSLQAAPTGSRGSYTPQDSALPSLQGSLSSLKSFNPDILVGGSQRDIAVRIGGSDFANVKSLPEQQLPPPPPTGGNYRTIDAHADPRGQIAIMTNRGSQIQKDLSPRNALPLQQQQQQPVSVRVPSSVSAQRPSAAGGGGVVGRSPLVQWGGSPFGSAQPKATTSSPLAGVHVTPLAPTSISPNKGGTVSWGVPPPAAQSEAKPKPAMPPPKSTPLTKPPSTKPPPSASNGGGVGLAHSSSESSLVKPQNKTMPFLGQGPVKNGLPQPTFGQAFPSLKFGGSTNPLGELKRSEPVGDLTQIRTSTQIGSSPLSSAAVGGVVAGSGTLAGHQSSSVPNVALTTKSESPLSMGVKFTSPPSFGLAATTLPAASSSISTSNVAICGLPASLKHTSGTRVAPPSSTLPCSTTASSVPFVSELASLLSTSKQAPIVSTSSVATAAGGTKPVFPFGGSSSGTTPQFTFSLGTSKAPSLTAGQSQLAPTGFSAPSVTTTHVTSTSLTTTIAPATSGSIFSSMPAFNFGSTFSKSPFQFSSMSSPASSAAGGAATPSTSTSPFGISGLAGSGALKFPFTSQTASSPQTTAGTVSTTTGKLSTVTTVGGSGIGESGSLKFPFTSQAIPSSQETVGALSTKAPTLATPGGSVSSPMLSTSTAAAKPFTFGMPSGTSFVFGNKSESASLSSMLSKTADPSTLLERRQREKREEEKEGEENGSSGGSSNESGGENQRSSPPSEPVAKPQDGNLKLPILVNAKPPLPVSLTAVQKPSTEDVSKTIPPVIKPPSSTSETAPASIVASKEKDAVPTSDAAETKGEGVPKGEEEMEKKSSPPSLSLGTAGEAEAEIEKKTLAPSKSTPESASGVAKGSEQKTETVPVPTITAVPVAAQITSPATATTTDKDKPPSQPTGDLKQAPPPTAIPKVEDGSSVVSPKVEGSVSLTAPKVQKSQGQTLMVGGAQEEKQSAAEKPSLVEKPTGTPSMASAKHVSFGGLQQEQLLPRMSASGSQGSLLSLDDLDTEADMEGEMEDATSEELSGDSGLFGRGGLGGMGGLGGRPSNATANPFGVGGIMAAGQTGLGGRGLMSGSSSSGGSRFLKPSPLGSSILSPPKFESVSVGRGLFSSSLGQPGISSSSTASTTGMTSSGFGASPSFGSGPGLGTGLGGFGSPPQFGSQSAMTGKLFGGVSTGAAPSFGSLSQTGGGGGGMNSFGGLAQQQSQSQQQSSSFGSGASFSQWR